jgi:plastocyanin
MRRFLGFLLVALATVGLAACGEENRVGDESLLNFREQAQQRLGETTTTTAPPTTTTTAPPAGAAGGSNQNTPRPTVATTATTRPARTPSAVATTTAPRQQQVATLEIAINTDAPFLQPEYARVFVGSIVRWVNRDSVPRAVKADTGQFVSPMIPPGGSFDYKAITVGLFDYADDTRPYAKAVLEVLPS